MDLNLVSQILRGLILEHGKVSLPLMGSFDLEDVPAGFAQGGSVMTPPSKRVIFNGFDIENDGLLEQRYAAERGITLEESEREIADLVNSMKTSLIDSKTFEIPGFGKILFGDDFKYGFEGDKSFNFSPDSYGLDELKVERAGERPVDMTAEVKENPLKNLDDDVKMVGPAERKESTNSNIADIGIPEHNPEFAKSQPAIDYDFNKKSVEGSVADIYKVAPAAIAPAAKPMKETVKGTIIVESNNEEKREDVEEDQAKAHRKEAEILYFKKKENVSKEKQETERFTPSAGVLGGHSYVFGQPLQSEATEVVVLGDNGKYEVEHNASGDEDKQRAGVEYSNRKTGDIGIAQSAIGALGVDSKPANVNDVEVNVVTKSPSLEGGLNANVSEENLSPEEIEIKKKLEAQQVAESEKKAEEKIWEAAKQEQKRKQLEEEARAEAARIEAEKKAAEELAARRRRGEIIDEDKTEIGPNGKPLTKIVKDIEGQDESAKESIAEIFTTVAEKEASAEKAEIVGEKEASKDWSVVENSDVKEEESAEEIALRDAKREEELANENAAKARAKEKTEAWAKKQKASEEQERAERNARNAKIFKYVKYFGYGVAAVVVLALVIYLLREPLKPVLEHLLYNADELRVIHYNL